MALLELPDVEQRSEEWYEQRRGIVTASVVHNLITAKTLKPANNDSSRGLTALLVAERITGFVDPTYQSDDMLRGVLDEPVARNAYAEHFSPVTEVGFMVRDDWGFKIGCSPDGLVGDVGMIEIKSRRQKKQLQTVLAGDIPAENMAQVQCALLVSGRAWLDYISYSGGMHLWVHRVYPDPKWHEAIIAAVAAFEETAAEMETTYRAKVAGLPMTERVNDLEIVI
jgi:hypothetical protein